MFQITCQCLASELGVILVFLCRTVIDVIKVVIFEQLTSVCSDTGPKIPTTL